VVSLEIPAKGASGSVANLQPATCNLQQTPQTGSFLRLRASDIQTYNLCEVASEVLIYFMVVLSPWAFGTTQAWSVWTMTIAGYGLGVLLALKLGLRRVEGYHPPRWDVPPAGRGRHGPLSAETAVSLPGRAIPSPAPRCTYRGDSPRSRWLTQRGLTILLGTTTVLLLGYCLLSALNARATYHEDTFAFEYHPCISWLPHSFDRPASWAAFWRYLGLACVFWAVVDWLPGKTRQEQYAQWQHPPGAHTKAGGPAVPARLRRLLWVLAMNGTLLCAEATIQRLADSPRLLFMVKPRIHQMAINQFGPFAYRANAAQYLNLLWPVCLGFWWTLNRTPGAAGKKHHWLLVCGAVIAAGPVISTSRGGAFVTLLTLVFGGLFLATFSLAARRRSNGQAKTLLPLGIFFAAVLVLGASLGWRALAPRLEQLDEGFAGRNLMYEAARPIAREFPMYGTGPGTFETVSYFYPRPDIFWPPQLHNDWLETRITFGLVGSSLLGLALLAVALRWRVRGGIRGGRRFAGLTWLALAGCLVHARFDFPFQVYSVLLLFLVLCALLFTLSRRQL
jgi:hypothetical protein